MLESACRHRSNVQEKQAQIARQRLPTKSTPYKIHVTFSVFQHTCKMAEKRQRGLAEMWQAAAPKSAFINSSASYSILFSFY